MRTFCRSIALGGFALLAAGWLRAFPIPPVNLWNLTARADLIVLARVDRVEERLIPTSEHDQVMSVAYLAVSETLKGPFVETLEVAFSANVVCPAPPRYQPGELVLAFLESSPSGLRTVARSYGTLYPKPSQLNDFRVAVTHALLLQNSLLPPDEAARDWAVEAARLPATRWHGLHELETQTGLPRLLRPGQVFRPKPLEPHRLQEIAKWFAQEPPVDPALPMALRLLADYESREVDLAAVSAVEAVMTTDPESFWLRAAVQLTLRRFGEADLAFKSSKAEALQDRWKRAKRELVLCQP